jgi:heptosyltransferase III
MGDVESRLGPVKAGSGRILVIRGGAIGDFVLTLPVITALRRCFPKASLEVLGSPPVLDLARVEGLAHATRSIESRGLAEFFVLNGSLAADWREYFSRFSIILSYLHDLDGALRENIAACSFAEFIAGPHRLDDGSHRHATEVLLDPLKHLAITNADPVPRLPVAALPDAKLPSGRWLALHPGSGSERKNWSEVNWRGFVTELIRITDLGLLLVGGEAEGNRLERMAALIPEKRLRLAQSLPLPTLAAYLSQCLGFVGHDSGISHLAAAVEVPAIILWGPTDPEVWRPLGRSISIVRSRAGIVGITVSEVLGQTLQLLRSPDSRSV